MCSKNFPIILIKFQNRKIQKQKINFMSPFRNPPDNEVLEFNMQ